MRTLLALALWYAGPALAAPEVPSLDNPSGRLLVHLGARITLETPSAADHAPGERVAVYLSEERPDPRTGEAALGLRYAGDARVVWVGADLVELELQWPEQALADGADAVLGAPRSASPTPTWTEPSAPEVQPASEAPAAPAVVESASEEPEEAGAALVEEPPDAGRVDGTHPTPAIDEVDGTGGIEAAPRRVVDRTDQTPGQRLFLGVDWADDGYGSGVGVGTVGWAWVPERGPGRVAVRLEGVRGMRWVAAEGGGRKEPWAREPAVGYWLWTGVEAAGEALAPRVGLALGVQETGPTAGLELGLRAGAPRKGHARLDYAIYGALGSRWTLEGAVPLSDRLRIGPRARVGALPLHQQPTDVILALEGADDQPWRQQRADGALRVAWDLSDHLTGTIGAGLAAYDLVLADAGPVLDLAMEFRW